MANPLKALGTAFLLRRLLHSTDRIGAALDQQNLLLARLADHFAPATPLVTAEDLQTSGPSFSRDAEQAEIQRFAAQMLEDVGREPTDEEIEERLTEVFVR